LSASRRSERASAVIAPHPWFALYGQVPVQLLGIDTARVT
jgi:hypothetical protein